MDPDLMELGVEGCIKCIVSLRASLKEGIIGQISLPCVRSANMCKNYYLCSHHGRKYRTNLECIRFVRTPDGVTTIKFTNDGRRKFLAEEFI
jgi:hypothetical protein